MNCFPEFGIFKYYFSLVLILVLIGFSQSIITILDPQDDKTMGIFEHEIREIGYPNFFYSDDNPNTFYSLDVNDLPNFITREGRRSDIINEMRTEMIGKKISVVNDYLFLAAKSCVILFDISNKDSPEIKSMFWIGGYVDALKVSPDLRFIYVTNHDIVIINIEDIDNWNIVSTIHVDGVTFSEIGLMGDFIYVGTFTSIVVVDVLDKENPQIVYTHTDQISFPNVILPIGQDYAFVGDGGGVLLLDTTDSEALDTLWKVAGAECNELSYRESDQMLFASCGADGLLVFDVGDIAVSPFSPIYENSTSCGSYAYSLHVVENNVFCLSAGDGMFILESTNVPFLLLLNDGIDTSGSTIWSEGDFTAVCGDNQIRFLNTTDLTSPRLIKSINLLGLGSNGEINGLLIDSDFTTKDQPITTATAFAGVKGFGVIILDILEMINTESNEVYGKYLSYIDIIDARKMQLKDNHLFISETNKGFHIYDVSDLSNPVLVNFTERPIDISGKIQCIICSDNDVCYVSCEKHGILVYDISELSEPIYIRNITNTTYTVGSNELLVTNDNNYLYSVGFNNVGMKSVFQIFDISPPGNPLNPVLVYERTDFDTPLSMCIEEDKDLLYVGMNEEFKILDISDRANPIILGSGNHANWNVERAKDINRIPETDFLCVVLSMQGILIFNVSDPTNPEFMFEIGESSEGNEFVIPISDNLLAYPRNSGGDRALYLRAVFDELNLDISPKGNDCGNYQINIEITDVGLPTIDSFNITVERYGHDFWTCSPIFCDSILANNTQDVCTSRGECIDHDICECENGSNRNSDTFCDDCSDYYIGYHENCGVYIPNNPSFNISFPDYPVSLCSEISFSAIDLDGYSLSFYWESPSHPFLNQMFDNSHTQFISNSSIIGNIEISVYCLDYWDRKSSVSYNFTIERNDSSSLVQPIIYGQQSSFITFVQDTEFYLEGDINLLCTLPSTDFKFLWEQVKIDNEPEIDFENIGMAQKKLKFTNGFPTNIDKNVEYKVMFKVITEHGNSSTSVLISVQLRDLIIITNESSRDVVKDLEIGINSYSSYDPEEIINQESFFLWKCFYRYMSSDPWINCENEEIILYDDDEQLCTFIPLNEGNYLIELEYQKDSRNVSEIIEFTSIDFGDYTYIPTIRINELEKPIQENEPINLIGTIEPDPEGRDQEIEFEWSCPSLTSNLTTLLLEPSNSDIFSLELLLKPNILVNEYTICYLTGKNEDYFSGNISAKIEIRKNESPMNGKILISPKRRFVLEDFFASFQNWEDEDIPLQYSLYYNHVISGREILIQPFSSIDSFQFFFSTQGCRSNNYSVSLKAKIRDNYHATRLISIDDEIIVEPVDFEDVQSYFEWITYLLDEWVISILEGSSDEEIEYSVSKGIKYINQGYSLLSYNCSDLTVQEQFCISIEECENGLIPVTSQLFKKFEDVSLKFINLTLYEMEVSDIETIFSIIEEIQITNYYGLSNLTLLFDVFDKFTEVIQTKIHASYGWYEIKEWWQKMIHLYEKMIIQITSISSSSTFFFSLPSDKKEEVLEIYSKVEKIIKYYLSIRFNGDQIIDNSDYDLVSTDSIKFGFVKDYSSTYVENLKYKTSEKSISSEKISVQFPSSLRYKVDSTYDIISCSIIQIKGLKLSYIGIYDSEVNKIGHENSERRTTSSFFETDEKMTVIFYDIEESEISYSCHELPIYDDENSEISIIVESSGGECDSFYYNSILKTISCECRRFNSLIYLGPSLGDLSSDDDDEGTGGLTEGELVGILGGVFMFCMILVVCCSSCIIGFLLLVLFIFGVFSILLLFFGICSLIFGGTCCGSCGSSIFCLQRKVKRKNRERVHPLQNKKNTSTTKVKNFSTSKSIEFEFDKKRKKKNELEEQKEIQKKKNSDDSDSSDPEDQMSEDESGMFGIEERGKEESDEDTASEMSDGEDGEDIEDDLGDISSEEEENMEEDVIIVPN